MRSECILLAPLSLFTFNKLTETQGADAFLYNNVHSRVARSAQPL
jgi:hypothetical protein